MQKKNMANFPSPINIALRFLLIFISENLLVPFAPLLYRKLTENSTKQNQSVQNFCIFLD